MKTIKTLSFFKKTTPISRKQLLSAKRRVECPAREGENKHEHRDHRARVPRGEIVRHRNGTHERGNRQAQKSKTQANKDRECRK